MWKSRFSVRIPSASLIVSIVALSVALGGGAYAASGNLSAHAASNNPSAHAASNNRGPRGYRGYRGYPGPPGAPGAPGAPGPTGPTSVIVRSAHGTGLGVVANCNPGEVATEQAPPRIGLLFACTAPYDQSGCSST